MIKKFKILWSFLEGKKIQYIAAITAVAIATLLSYSIPLVIRFTIDSVIGDKPLSAPFFIISAINKLGGIELFQKKIWISGLVIIFLTLTQGLFTYMQGRWASKSSESGIMKLREKLYNHLQHLPFTYHSKAKTGDLIQRCTSDVETIRRFISVQFVSVGRTLIMIIIVLPIMLSLNVKMTLISMLIIPIIFFFAVIFFLKVKAAFKLSDESDGELSTVLQENLSGIRVVRAFARQNFETDKFNEKNVNYRNLTYRLIVLLAWYWSISDLLCLTQIAIVLIFGSYMASNGTLSLGTLVVFITYVGLLLWPIRQMGRVLTDMGKAFVSLDRIKMILDEPLEERILNNHNTPTLLLNDYSNHKGDINGKLDKVIGDIVFDNVSFKYDENIPVLKNISFQVKPGQIIALLGQTGSGKSTLVNLLPRLYEYTEGSIKIDGVELNEIDRYWLRKQISIVLQEPFLYSRTIMENIKMGKSHTEENEIYNATNVAVVHDVILDFDNGYKTLVGEKGVTLSGGQKQRVAIARAILQNSPILIFDDSFSAVDTETDLKIRKALKERHGRATTFIIAHRITTLAEADLILVIDDGEIKQSGSHNELIKQDGLYRRIWNIQNELEEDISIELTKDNVKNLETAILKRR